MTFSTLRHPWSVTKSSSLLERGETGFFKNRLARAGFRSMVKVSRADADAQPCAGGICIRKAVIKITDKYVVEEKLNSNPFSGELHSRDGIFSVSVSTHVDAHCVIDLAAADHDLHLVPQACLFYCGDRVFHRVKGQR